MFFIVPVYNLFYLINKKFSSAKIGFSDLLKNPEANWKCTLEPILPFGNILKAQVGDFFSLYCAPRSGWEQGQIGVHWILPNDTEIWQQQQQVKNGWNSGEQMDRTNADNGKRVN
jgi:hypothetical protein